MLKARKRWISLLVTLAMLVAFVVPFAGPASAGAASYTAVTTIPQFDPGATNASSTWSATVQVKFDPAISGQLSEAYVEVLDSSGAQLDINGYNVLSATTVGAVYLNDGQINSPTGEVSLQPSVKKIKLGILPNNSTDPTAKATVNLKLRFDAKDCAAGDVKFNVFGSTGQFEDGQVVVARATGGAVTVALVGSVPTIGSDSTKNITFRLSESSGGALKAYTGSPSPSVKIKLPAGFKWVGASSSSGNVYAQPKSGDNRTLEIYCSSASSDRSIYDITATIAVADTDVAKYGDVVATVEGDNDTTVSPSEITVATYADYGVNVSVASVPTLIAGKYDQKTDKITIEEKIPGSLISGRRITIELPSWVKIESLTDKSTSNVDEGTNKFQWPDNAQIDYTDNKIDLYMNGLKSDKAKFEFKMKLNIEANHSGDLVATVSGAGIPETSVTLAKVVPAVTAAATASDVKIGVQDQAAPDIILTENVAGAIVKQYNEAAPTTTDGFVTKTVDGGKLSVILPDGVQFSGTPKVEVTSGDIDIKADQARVVDDPGYKRAFEIPIKSESLKASTIKISGIKLTLDRTVPEGPLTVKVIGNAVVENSGSADYEFTTDKATEFVLANCVTPAPGEQKGTAVFKIGETKYTVNGKEVTMDVAPVAEAGRTYLPARFVANAMGVPDSNIIWDQANQTVTVIRNERIVQMKVGSNQILVNGIALTMDAAPKVVPGRVLIPFRFLAQALGAEVVWDPADPNTITLNF
ncbi:MAG TPA: copper amine oxidase N-terminal domain-containing protein [Syntrophomonadaceae bacterium]|nr:copper amine oxidase N-terminal domain-containing protein [Syntrophomonadaceae bacterium]